MRGGLGWRLPTNLTVVTERRFESDVYARRLAAAAAGAAKAGLAGLIVTPGYDLRYLIGSRAQTFERLTAPGHPGGRAADGDRPPAGTGDAQGIRQR